MSRKFILGALFCLIIQQLPIQAQVAKTAEVKAFNGKPSLFVDGQVLRPTFTPLPMPMVPAGVGRKCRNAT